MHACMPVDAQSSSVLDVSRIMAEWSMMDREWPPDGSYDPYSYETNDYYQEYQETQPPLLSEYFPPPAQQYNMPQHQWPPPQRPKLPAPLHTDYASVVPRGENPREIRNKAEKQRRDKLNHSISELAAMVPTVVAANKKIDKTGVLRLTAHYIRAHQYVFGDSVGRSAQEFSPESAQLLLSLLGGFLLTTTYKGLVVVVSQNVQQYLGHTELDLLGHNILSYIHPDDHRSLKQNLMPNAHLLGPNGELLIPEDPDGKKNIAEAFASDKRRFLIRFKKHTQRSEPVTYVLCYVEGTLRRADRACRVSSRCCQVVRRARARGDNPCSSGNDVVFIGLVRPTAESFISERRMEAYRMEYRTRHTVDGEIMECEQRISMVAGYMTHEVNGVNAMNFIHRDDVRWVIFSLREMYDQHRLVGESCYRLMAKSGQFIYMRTRGSLDVDQDTRAVRSFVCTNTVVDEEEGKHLIEIMKKRCMMVVNYHKSPSPAIEELKVEETLPKNEFAEDDTLPVQDLEKVILHLVTNLPSPQPGDSRSNSPERDDSPSLPLSIIPPRRERILSAIEKIYSVIKAADKREQSEMVFPKRNYQCHQGSPTRSSARSKLLEQNQNLRDTQTRRQLEGLPVTCASFSGQMENGREILASTQTRRQLDGEACACKCASSSGQMENGREIPASAAVPEASPLASLNMPQVSTGVSEISEAEENFVQDEKDRLQNILMNTGDMNAIQEYDFEPTPLQPNQASRKRGQIIEQTTINKKINIGVVNQGHSTNTHTVTLQALAPQPLMPQATTSEAITPQAFIPSDMIPLVDPFSDFDINATDEEVQNLEELDLSSLWNFKKTSQ